MIKWNSTRLILPLAGKEIIAKNPPKPISYNNSSKQCRIMKFHPSFTEQQIYSAMLENDENLTLWSYVEGTGND